MFLKTKNKGGVVSMRILFMHDDKMCPLFGVVRFVYLALKNANKMIYGNI